MKLIKVVAVLLLFSIVFSACGTGTSQNAAGGTDNTAPEKQTSVENSGNQEKTVLTLEAVGGSNEQAFVDLIEDIIVEFNETNEFNVEIKAQWFENQQYKTRLTTSMASNAAPDIFFTWEADFLKPYVESGKVYEIGKDIEADAEWNDRYLEGAFSSVTFDDKVFGAPSSQGVIPMYYNKRIFDEVGVSVPETWGELIETCIALKKAGFIPISLAAQDAWVSAQVLLEISGGTGGPELFEKIVSGATTWDDEGYVKAGELLQELVEIGAFPDGFLGLEYGEGTGKFISGEAAMYHMGTWETGAILNGVSEEEAKNISAFLLPTYKPELSGCHIATVEKIFAVSANCKNPEAAAAFLKMITEPKNQERFVVELGALPVTVAELDESKIDNITLDIMALQEKINAPLTPMDRQFGANEGGEFNNISQAIASGANPEEQFKLLQEYSEAEAQR